MKDEFENIEELQQFLNQQAAIENAKPREQMDNLSSNDMQLILYHTFEKESPLAFKKNLTAETVDKIPFIKLMKVFLDLIHQNKELKLTSLGYIPPKICKELYGKKILTEWAIENGIVNLNKETDSVVLQTLKIISTQAGLIKKRKNKLSLTALGKKIVEKELSVDLFQKVFNTNWQKFNLGFHDGYPHETSIQMTFGYTLYLLLRYGQERRPFDFYVEKNLTAFPQELENFSNSWTSPEKAYFNCYKVRIFERFLKFYGFIELNKRAGSSLSDEKWDIKTTQTFQDSFEIINNNFRFLKNKIWA
jgi:hypothetical protein